MTLFSAASRYSGVQTSNTQNHVIDWTGQLGTVAAGDGILIAFISDDVDNTAATGYTKLGQVNGSGAGNMSLSAFWLKAAGGETGVTVTTTGNEQSAYKVWRFASADIDDWAVTAPEWSTAVSTIGSATVDPPSHTASWTAGEDNSWVIVGGQDGPGSVTAYPANTTDQTTNDGNGVCGGYCDRYDTALDTFNPTAFTFNGSDSWAAATICIRAATGAAAINVPIGTASETDTAQPITPTGSGQATAALGAGSETDTALAITPTGSGAAPIAIGTATEADTAHPITASLSATFVPIGTATEADTAHPITTSAAGSAIVAIGTAPETDTALPITSSSTGAVLLGSAIEADTAEPITPTGSGTASPIPVGTATETDTAQPITPTGSSSATIPVGTATEADTAHPITTTVGTSGIPIGTATETDTALAVTVTASGTAVIPIGTATEADTAHPIILSGSDVVPGRAPASRFGPQRHKSRLGAQRWKARFTRGASMYKLESNTSENVPVIITAPVDPTGGPLDFAITTDDNNPTVWIPGGTYQGAWDPVTNEVAAITPLAGNGQPISVADSTDYTLWARSSVGIELPVTEVGRIRVS